jgi:hypothetical protein
MSEKVEERPDTTSGDDSRRPGRKSPAPQGTQRQDAQNEAARPNQRPGLSGGKGIE